MFIDEGSQLVKACKDVKLNWIDIANNLNSKHQVGVDFVTCPVGAHDAHGVVERAILEVKRIFYAVYKGLKLDILSYETAFAWTANELNNLPICLGSRTENLGNTDLITPSRLMLGRNNRRAPTDFAELATPSRLLNQLRQVRESWWKVWKDEKLMDHIPQPKWFRSSPELKEGDIVIFLRDEDSFSKPCWKIAKVKSLSKSADGKVRSVELEYKNASESSFRTTRRSVRKVALIHSEEDLDLIDKLNIASKSANLSYLSQTETERKQMEIQGSGRRISPRRSVEL